MITDIIKTQFLKSLEKTQYGKLTITMADGTSHEFIGPEPGPISHVTIMDENCIPAFISKGDIGLAETYRDGLWDTDDLEATLLFGVKNEEALQGYIMGNNVQQFLARFLYTFSRNSLRGSKKNIHAHYDIGNDFYKLWLDEGLSYSSALYKGEGEKLEDAQDNKYDRILERLDNPSGNLLEIGCGWGGFAERAVEKGDYGIKGITLSNEQHNYAAHRLGDNADIVLEDYRKQSGKFDHIVSIEMFEAVGEKYWPTYFKKLASLLEANGKAVVQSITIAERFFDEYRKSGDMIRSFIFPGGMLPSKELFKHHAEKAGLKLNDVHFFGQDYAKTLQTWLKNFDAAEDKILKLGLDDKFIRIWRLYLAYCYAGFAAERTDVGQFELELA